MWYLAPIGAILYRMRGGWPDIPRPIEQMLFCLPIAYVGWGLSSPHALTALAYVLSVIVTLRGHGRNFDLGHSHKSNDEVEPEWYEFLIDWLRPYMSEYWYDVLGISLSGLLITLPLIFISPILAFCGILKGLAYMIGWTGKLPAWRVGKFTVEHETEWGEFLTGLFIWSCLLYG